MKAALFLLLVSFSALADYKSELPAIDKFEADEYVNKKNYAPAKPGEPLTIPTREFYNKLQADPKSLKYFIVLGTLYKLMDRYKVDRAFALSLESKFGGKKIDRPKWETIFELVTNNILKESNAEHKKAITDLASSKAHFEKHLALLNKASF